MDTEWVIVDDFDPAIAYTGLWVSTLSATDSVSSEIAYQNTAHTATTTPAGFSYSFSGSRVAIYGVAAFFNQTIDASTSNLPIWECLIDNVAIANDAPYGTSFPIQTYCHKDGLSNGPHTIAFRVTQSGVGLWFDSITYLPSPGSSIPASATAWVQTTDARISYAGLGWQSFGMGMAVVDTNKNVEPSTEPLPSGESTFSIEYSGSSVTWYALSKAAIAELEPEYTVTLPIDNPPNITGSYQVDGGSRTSFNVDLAGQSVAPTLNPFTTILFKAPSPGTGVHNLTVFYDSNNSTLWPLTLDHLTIENAFGPRDFIPGGPAKKGSKAAVVGGAVGGVIGGLLLVFLGLFFLRRWRLHKRRQERNSRAVNLATNDIKLRPFTRIVEGTSGAHEESEP